MAGRYIVIEGHDGTGKTTQVNLLKTYFKALCIYLNNKNEVSETNSSKKINKLR